MGIKKMIEAEVERWGSVGHPAPVLRFLLRNGREYPAGTINEEDREAPGMCFENAANIALWGDMPYVEGVAWHPKLPMLIDHAWNNAGGDAYDVTWPAYGGREYFGVEVDADRLRAELLKNKVYGLLDIGSGYNLDFIYAIDPGLREIVEEVRKEMG